MNEEKKNLNEQELSADEIETVAGGQGNSNFATWDSGEERKLQADYVANGAGMSLDDFLKARGMSDLEIACRDKWIGYGAYDDVIAVGERRGGIHIVETW